MKRISIALLVVITITIAIVQSCKKEDSCQGCNTINNIPPTAVAGADQTIKLSANSTVLNSTGTLLDGSASTDPDGKIKEWVWTQIAGRDVTSIINHFDAAKMLVSALVQGVYQFELKVTDDKGQVRETLLKWWLKKTQVWQ